MRINHKLDMKKLEDFKRIVLPYTRKLIEDEVTYYGLKSTISDLEKSKQETMNNLTAVKAFPNIATKYSSYTGDLQARLSYFSGLRKTLEAELAECEGKIKPHKKNAESLKGTIDYQKEMLNSILGIILKDTEGFLQPDDIHKNREYKYEILYILCTCSTDSGITNSLMSLQACNALADECRQSHPDLYIAIMESDNKVAEFYKQLYDIDICNF